MDFAELEFEYHPVDRLLWHCRWLQNPLLSVQALVLCRFLRVFTLKFLPDKVGVLASGNQCVRNRIYVQTFGCSGDMQATKNRQSVQQNDRSRQGCPTLTLKRGCICLYWFIRLPSRSEVSA